MPGKGTHEEHAATFRAKVSEARCKALNAAVRMLGLGTNYNRRHLAQLKQAQALADAKGITIDEALASKELISDDPPPADASEAQKYAQMRLKAMDIIVQLSGSHKVNGPVKPIDGDELLLLKKRLRLLPEADLRQWLIQGVRAEKLSVKQANELLQEMRGDVPPLDIADNDEDEDE